MNDLIVTIKNGKGELVLEASFQGLKKLAFESDLSTGHGFEHKPPSLSYFSSIISETILEEGEKLGL